MSIPAARRALSGDRNQCPTCALYFNSTRAFDVHRTGEWSQWKDGEYRQHSRRCMTVEEMTAKGMFERDGWWYSKRNLGFKRGSDE